MLLASFSLGTVSCASAYRTLKESSDYGTDARGVWVRGPWESITPSRDIDEVIDQLCPTVMQLEGARGHDDGLEYCGLLYARPDGTFHASAPSPLAAKYAAVSSPNKTCRIPNTVKDGAGVSEILADYHSHCWPDSPLTAPGDTGESRLRWSIRIQFDTTCRVLKLVPHRGEPVPGEVFERAGKQWRRIAIIRLEDKVLGIPTPSLQEAR
ncbi:MAG TPA: hypothetical protein VFB81_03975 [Myxococcales bacterium]|nr:hypothetical protein [Myxococcales bacterium]